jgi:hypothetical protein
MHAAVPIALSAFLLVTAALLLPLGILIGRRMPPTASAEGVLLPQPQPVPSFPARNRPVAIYASCVGLRAPPTFPSQSSVSPPGFRRSRE